MKCFQGAELAAQEVNCAAALAACRTLAEELSESRFPAPRILAFKVRLFHFAAVFSTVVVNISTSLDSYSVRNG